MKKIVFCNVKIYKPVESHRYKVNGNSTIEYKGKVAYPINGVLARTLKSGDDVKVVLLKKNVNKDDVNDNSEKNLNKFKSELKRINKNIGANIEYKTLYTPHDESREVQETLLREMIDELVDGAHIYADITYGPKSLPIIVFSVLNFAEKFFNAEIKNIVYGKVDHHENDKTSNPELFDMTALFYLNSIANTMECKDGKAAKKLLDIILSE